MQFNLSIATVLAFAALVAADIAALKSDVTAIDTSVTKLNNDLQATSGTSYVGALGIDSDAKDTNKKVQAATTEAQNTDSVSEADAQSIIDQLTKTEVTVKAATDRLVALEPKFKSIGVAGIAKGDVSDLQASVKAFGEAIIAKAPADKTDAANALIAKYNADLANAAAAYASD